MCRKTIVHFVLGWLLGTATGGALRRPGQGRDGADGPLTLRDLDAEVGL